MATYDLLHQEPDDDVIGPRKRRKLPAFPQKLTAGEKFKQTAAYGLIPGSSFEEKFPHPNLFERTVQVHALFHKNDSGLLGLAARKYTLGLELSLVPAGVALSDTQLKACMGLVDETSGADYRASVRSWKPENKKEEMLDRSMMYILVHTMERGSPPLFSDIIGFMSFMFTNDDPPMEDREVVYLYEIHLTGKAKGRGLGSLFMRFLEEVAREEKVTKTMLTVFKSNKGARAFYESHGYVKDACSPEPKVTRTRVYEPDYIIMSKELV